MITYNPTLTMQAVHMVDSFRSGAIQIAIDTFIWMLILLGISLFSAGWLKAVQLISKYGNVALAGAAFAIALLLAFLKLHFRIVFF